MAGHDDQALAGLDELEDHLEDVARHVAHVHDVRAPLDHRELALVEGQRDVDAAQVAGAGRVLDHLQVLVCRRGEQVREHRVALDLCHAEQLRPQLGQHGRQVVALGLVGLLRPPVLRRELEVTRDRVVDRVEQVLEVPPGDA
ncbi:MAG TPA: hypothetical protein VFX80_03035 [Solirubrobacteraceae bacterium]|nr:hypothetical protein [Solirubrobacteraceae bacterium]